MSYRGRSRPGKGSTKPANVKLRPAPAPEERAKPRTKGTGRNARPQDDSSDDEEEDEADKLAREQFAVADHREGEEEQEQDQGDEKRPLEGMTVCTSGQFDILKEQLRSMCVALGATFDIILTTDTTFLICNTTDSDKYRACVANGIPVLTSDFIAQLHAQWISAQPGLDVKSLSESLRLPPLSGLTICLSGYDGLGHTSKHRDTITLQGGAAYLPDLRNEVTHLVLGPNIRNKNDLFNCGKFKAAKLINKKRAQSTEAKRPISIVWGEWLEHSLGVAGRVPEDHYSADLYQDRETCKPPVFSRAKDIITRREEDSPAKTRKGKRKEAHAQLKAKRRTIKQESQVMAKELETDGVAAEEVNGRRKRPKVDADISAPEILVEETMLHHGAEPDEREAPEPAVLRHKSRSLSAQPVAPTSALPQESKPDTLEPRAILRKQQSSTDMELQGVQNLLGQERRESTQRRSLGPNSSIGSLNLKTEKLQIGSATNGSGASILSKMGAARSSKFSSKTREDGSSISISQTTSSLQLGTSIPPSASTSKVTLDEDADMASSEIEESARVLEGKVLYLLYQDKTPAQLAHMAHVIEDRGGKVVSQDGQDVGYVVCEALKDAPPEYDPCDTRVVTGMWLEALLYADDGLPDSCHPLAQVFKTPVRCALPLPGVKHLNVSFRGFDDEAELPALKETLSKLGIEHSATAHRNITTHLLVPDTFYQSAVLDKVREWGLPIVSPRWIRDLTTPHVHDGKKPNEIDNNGRQQIASTEITHSKSKLEVEVPHVTNILTGCHIHVTSSQNRRALQDLAERLGAKIIHVLDADMMQKTTHVVYETSGKSTTTKEIAKAQRAKIKIVHPDWLKDCETRGERLTENAYKPTRNSKRTLEVVINSQPLSRGSSSTSGHSGNNSQVILSDDELPPPLRRRTDSDGHAHASQKASEMPSSSSPKDVLDGSYTAGPAVDDSGFVPSSDKRKCSITGEDDSSSPRARSKNGMHATGHSSAAISQVTGNSRDIMAEMEALMQADLAPQQLNARLGYQQPGPHGRPIRKVGLKKEESDAQLHSSPKITEAMHLGKKVHAHRHNGYGGYMETQFGGKYADVSTQDEQDEQTMVIRINDPVAEATKAKLLAGIRDAQLPKHQQAQSDAYVDEDATQPDTQETSKSTRSTRSTTARRR